MKLDSNTFLESHPFQIARILSDRHESNIEFEFSRYIYRPQQLFDERITFNLTGDKLSEVAVIKLLNDLKQDEELAFHSKVIIKGKTQHIPMIDFSIGKWGENVWDELRKYIERKILNELLVFSSGRSFHAYSTSLLTPGNWREFMGRLLLVNAPDKPAIIDSRWIGHRLIGGYCSLRWSCNTGQYVGYPSQINPILFR